MTGFLTQLCCLREVSAKKQAVRATSLVTSPFLLIALASAQPPASASSFAPSSHLPHSLSAHWELENHQLRDFQLPRDGLLPLLFFPPFTSTLHFTHTPLKPNGASDYLIASCALHPPPSFALLFFRVFIPISFCFFFLYAPLVTPFRFAFHFLDPFWFSFHIG